MFTLSIPNSPWQMWHSWPAASLQFSLNSASNLWLKVCHTDSPSSKDNTWLILHQLEPFWTVIGNSEHRTFISDTDTWILRMKGMLAANWGNRGGYPRCEGLQIGPKLVVSKYSLIDEPTCSISWCFFNSKSLYLQTWWRKAAGTQCQLSERCKKTIRLWSAFDAPYGTLEPQEWFQLLLENP